MKKTVLTFRMAPAPFPRNDAGDASLIYKIGFDKGMIIGYTSMVAALLMVFFGIRSYRDGIGNGSSPSPSLCRRPAHHHRLCGPSTPAPGSSSISRSPVPLKDYSTYVVESKGFRRQSTEAIDAEDNEVGSRWRR